MYNTVDISLLLGEKYAKSNIIGLIANYPDDANSATILSDLSNKNQIIIDNTMYTYKTLVLKYGIEFSTTILGKLKAAAAQNPLLDATYYAICSTGIDFSATPTQDMIHQLTNVIFTQDEADKLLSLGIIKQSILDKFGLTNITVDDISQAIADRKYQRT